MDRGAPRRLRRPGRRLLGPRAGAPGHETWEVGRAHFAERFQLFIIIVLGESIVVTGATTSGRELTVPTVIAFALAFLGTAALWWLYFNFVTTIVQRRLELSESERDWPVTPTPTSTSLSSRGSSSAPSATSS